MTHDRYALEQVPSRLVLRRRGLPHAFGARLGWGLVLLSFFSIATATLVGGFADVLAPGCYLEWAWVWRIAVAPLPFLLIGGLIAGGMIYRVSRAWSYWRRISFDACTRSLEAAKIGWLGFGSERVVLRSDELGEIFVRIGAEAKGRLVPCVLCFEVPPPFDPADPEGEEAESDWIEVELTVERVDRREEALDLVFRIARALGRESWIVVESGARFLTVGVVRDGSEYEGSRRVPAAGAPASYAQDVLATPVELPERQVAGFAHDPEDAVGSQIAIWDPGTRVHFRRAAPSVPLVIGVGLVLGAIAAGALGLDGDTPGAFVDRLLVLGPLGVAGFWIFAHRDQPQRDVRVDWLRRRVVWRGGWLGATPGLWSALTRLGRRFRAPFEEVDELVLAGHYRERSSGSRPVVTRQEYVARLELRIGGRSVPVLESDDWDDDPDVPHDELAPASEALARALGVPWRWAPYRRLGPGARSASVASFAKALLLCGVAFAMACFFALGRYDEFQRRGYEEMIESLGARVESRALTVDDVSIFGEGWVIEVTDPAFDDDDLVRLHAILARAEWPTALDLSGTRVTDAGTATLSDLASLRWLDLSDTAASDGFLQGQLAR